MEPTWITAGVVALGFLLTMIVTSVNVTNALARSRMETDTDAERRQKEVLERLDRETRSVGETIAAIRQEFNNFRILAAETFQRRDSYHTQMSTFNLAMNNRFETIEEKIEGHFAKVDAKLEKMDEKLDRRRPD